MQGQPEIIVIGGGINGVSTAFQLARCGVAVRLIERNFIASGPTGWSSAIIRQHYSNPETARLAQKSLAVWQNFAEVVGGEAGYTQTGFLMGVRPSDVEGLKANIRFLQTLGINTHFVSPKELQDLDPQIDPTGLGGAAYEPDGGYCDPAAAANSYARAAQRLGADIRTGVTAIHLEQRGGRIQGVATDQGFLPAEAVVIAAGPWSTRLLEQLGVTVPIINARVKIGLFQRPDDFQSHRVLGDFVGQVYMRPETGGLMLVGSISPDEALDLAPDPDQFNAGVALDALADFAERAARRYPAMNRGHLFSSFASLYDITPDWHAILDSVPGVEGLYLCAGSSGHGFKLAPAVGELMADLVLNGKRPGEDINLFAFDRFETGNEIHGRYEYSIVG